MRLTFHYLLFFDSNRQNIAFLHLKIQFKQKTMNGLSLRVSAIKGQNNIKKNSEIRMDLIILTKEYDINLGKLLFLRLCLRF